MDGRGGQGGQGRAGEGIAVRGNISRSSYSASHTVFYSRLQIAFH